MPTLIVSGERDPATPASDGEKTARNLRNGIHVVVVDGTHSNIGRKGQECEEQMRMRLIETGSTDGSSGFEMRVEVNGGKYLRASYSDGGALIFVPTSPTRFRTPYGGYGLVFRLEEGRAAGVGLERSGQSQGDDLKRVP